jgi:hypothetical protein
MNLQRIAVLSAIAIPLTIVAVGQAKLPSPKVKTIVPGVSVAGVKLGMTTALAKKTLGPGSVCGVAAFPNAKQCTWSVTPNARPDRSPKITIVTLAGKVRAITVDGGTGGAAIKSFRTVKGIGIGSTRAALFAAYPKLKTPFGADNPSLGSGRTTTSFFIQGGRVKLLQVGSPG